MAVYLPSMPPLRACESSVAQALVSMRSSSQSHSRWAIPQCHALRWLDSVVGFLAHVSFALCLLGWRFGLAAKSSPREQWPVPFVLLPLVGSGIGPTRSMSTGVRYFDYFFAFAPNTSRHPMINTLAACRTALDRQRPRSRNRVGPQEVCALGLFLCRSGVKIASERGSEV